MLKTKLYDEYTLISYGQYRMFGRSCMPQIRTHFSLKDVTTDSSVGRAGDCRSDAKSDISRSLVQIRLGGLVLKKQGHNIRIAVWSRKLEKHRIYRSNHDRKHNFAVLIYFVIS